MDINYKKKRLAEALEELKAKKSNPKPQAETKSQSKSSNGVPKQPTPGLKKTKKFHLQSLTDVRTTNGKIVLIIVSIILSVIVHQIVNLLPADMFKNLKDLQSDLSDIIPRQSLNTNKQPKPIYSTYHEDGTDDTEIRYVHRVLETLGLQHGDNRTDWDLLWAHNSIINPLPSLKPHQKVNHYPGSGYISNKISLLTTENVASDHKSFLLPYDQLALLEYSRLNPTKLFLQKTENDVDLIVKSYDKLDLNAPDSLVQVFIDNPLLIDGHKFDLGVFVAITSVHPLRAYIYTGDIYLKFCPEKYEPFVESIPNKYVATEEILPTWKLPTFSKFNQLLGYSRKDSLNAYLTSLGVENIELLWTKIEDAIRLVLLERESLLLDKSLNAQNFFQIIRFDLMIDDTYNAYILEAIMSPFVENKEAEELNGKVLYNFFNLLGIGTPIERESFRNRSRNIEDIVSSNINIATFPDVCANEPCTESCEPLECNLCLKCLSNEDRSTLHAAYREHINKGDSRRMFPLTGADFDYEWFEALDKKNQLISRWFYGKCLQEPSWCY